MTLVNFKRNQGDQTMLNYLKVMEVLLSLCLIRKITEIFLIIFLWVDVIEKSIVSAILFNEIPKLLLNIN